MAIAIVEAGVVLAAELGIDTLIVEGVTEAATELLGEEAVETLSETYSTFQKASRLASAMGTLGTSISNVFSPNDTNSQNATSFSDTYVLTSDTNKEINQQAATGVSRMFQQLKNRQTNQQAATGVSRMFQQLKNRQTNQQAATGVSRMFQQAQADTTSQRNKQAATGISRMLQKAADAASWHDQAVQENRITNQKRGKALLGTPLSMHGPSLNPGKTLGDLKSILGGVHFMPPPRANEQPQLTLPPMDTTDVLIPRGNTAYGLANQLFRHGRRRLQSMPDDIVDGGAGSGFKRIFQNNDPIRDNPDQKYEELVDVVRSGTRYTHNVTQLPMNHLPGNEFHVGEYLENPNFPKASDGSTLAPDLMGMGAWPTHASITDGHTAPLPFGANQVGANNPSYGNFSSANLASL